MSKLVPFIDTRIEKIRSLIALNDDVAKIVSHRAGPAFFRAFILEDRVTSAIYMKFRWSYINPTKKSWHYAPTGKLGESGVEFLRVVIEDMLRKTSEAFLRRPLAADEIEIRYPPDDKGDIRLTLLWLQTEGLMELTNEKFDPNE